MVFIITGNGKGKTTSAIGQALRALGSNKKVLMVQFIKSPEWTTGEVIAAKKFEPSFILLPMGRGFVGIMGDKLPREEHENAAMEAFEYAKNEFETCIWDVLILDEINVALNLNLLPLDSVLDFVKIFPEEKELLLTGRSAPKEFYEHADYISDVQDIKHPFQEGVMGKKGTEW